ncbi:hypothetical protein GCM10010472_21170 [Pseudonocardia halophobica]|uniref:Uncharacterized protein n=1 Tax=Pseudonocardia halophobica TaxID=29401 RepID=A0A9W6KZB5_9PSEU|nr:hypothetical protein [Pseudonocardia halophobica]GLL09349.1 hypothetical protein GCM10017577_04890 [Pseudonocardia halophobica]
MTTFNGGECPRTAEQVAALLGRASEPEVVDHLRCCPTCRRTVELLRAEPGVDPDLELRLLRVFQDRPE